MRLQVLHESTYRYDVPQHSVTELVRLTPRGHEGQFVVDWRIEVDHDCRMRSAEDAFGNHVQSFSLSGPIDAFTITATGEVEIDDTHGIIRRQIERFPPTIFLRETDLTKSGNTLRTFADDVGGGRADQLSRLHALNGAIYERMTFESDRTDATTSAMEAFSSGHGVCQDYAHIFVAAARHLEIPARYVSGYLFQPDDIEQEAGHGWAEALVEGLGWVAFDPTHGIAATDSYVRVAVGLDYLSAAPVRGARYGGGDEELSVRVRVEEKALR